MARVAPSAREELSLISGTFEQLVGEQRAFAFALVGPENEPVRDADVEAWVVPASGQAATGPFSTTFREVPGQPLGLYVARIDIPAAGATSFVAVTDDDRAAVDTVQVVTAETSQLPAPTQEAIVVPTPTFSEPLGMENVCTLSPPCGMHEISLDEAIAQGRPVALQFATPAFCMTAVCGPSVEVLEQVRTERDWGDVAFIHMEIYRDAGQTVADPVQEWGLPSEPWLFTIDGGGTIVDRMDGPLLTLPDHVAGIIEGLT